MTSPSLEHAILDVLPDQTNEFLTAFAMARPLIESQTGFRGLQLLQCTEYSARFLLLVEWDNLEDHTIGFRQSTEYVQWRDLLHHFYDPMPEVTHYDVVTSTN